MAIGQSNGLDRCAQTGRALGRRPTVRYAILRECVFSVGQLVLGVIDAQERWRPPRGTDHILRRDYRLVIASA